MKFEGFSTASTAPSPVSYIKTTLETFPADYQKLRSERIYDAGDYGNVSDRLNVYFTAIIGAPESNTEDDAYDIYRNTLFTFREDLIKLCDRKCVMYMGNSRSNPTSEELTAFADVPRNGREAILQGFISAIHIPSDPVREKLAKDALHVISADYPDEQLFGFCAKMIIWLYRCTKAGIYARTCKEIPVVLYYGNITRQEIQFLHFISCLGMDVIYISESKQAETMLRDENRGSRADIMQIFTMPSDNPVTTYPDRLMKVKVATEAYRAERQLDEYLYGGDTFFRDFQFTRIHALTLKTTRDEIDVIWHEQAKFRSGFKVDGNRATVPNIFAKISGVKNSDMDDYWDNVRYKLSPMSRLFINSPSLKAEPDERILRPYRRYIVGEHILIQELKSSPLNTLQYLSDDLQYTLFEKMQEAADSGFLKLDFAELIPRIIHAGLTLERPLLQILQKYDYTKDIPKCVSIDTIEATFSKTECIRLVLLNFLGFDIIIFTPTGYRNLETFVDDSAFERYTQGDFKYNLAVPRFRIPDKIPEPDTGGFFGKLFKKR